MSRASATCAGCSCAERCVLGVPVPCRHSSFPTCLVEPGVAAAGCQSALEARDRAPACLAIGWSPEGCPSNPSSQSPNMKRAVRAGFQGHLLRHAQMQPVRQPQSGAVCKVCRGVQVSEIRAAEHCRRALRRPHCSYEAQQLVWSSGAALEAGACKMHEAVAAPVRSTVRRLGQLVHQC